MAVVTWLIFRRTLMDLNRLSNPTDLAGSDLDGIAAVVLGGRPASRRSGTAIGTLLGVILAMAFRTVILLVGILTT